MTEDHLSPRVQLPASANDAPCPARGEDPQHLRLTPGAKPWQGDHPINIRISIPIFGRRYYVTLVAGKERRSPSRLALERKKHPLKTTGNILFLTVLGTVVGVGVLSMILFAALAILRTNGALVAVP